MTTPINMTPMGGDFDQLFVPDLHSINSILCPLRYEVLLRPSITFTTPCHLGSWTLLGPPLAAAAATAASKLEAFMAGWETNYDKGMESPKVSLETTTADKFGRVSDECCVCWDSAGFS